MSTAGKYVTELSHVREVSLLGTGDLAFWTDYLSPKDLAPVEREGRAEILVVAAAMRFMGVQFTETSFSVLVQPPLQRTGDAAFLLRGFNSCRLFAACERVLFSTPYMHGDCRISTVPPVSVQVIAVGQTVFRAAMATGPPATGREPSRAGEAGWEGPIFLPAGRRESVGRRRVFFARLRGHTLAYRFLPEQDVISIRPSGSAEVLQLLLDSGFTGREWLVRADAVHARSKTSARPGSAAGPRGEA